MFVRSTAALGTILSLSACSADGSLLGALLDSDGGSPRETAFTTISALPADGVTVIDGQAVTAGYTANLATGNVAVATPSGPSDSRARLTTEDEIGVALSVSAPGSSASFDTRAGDGAVDFDGVIGFATADGQDSALIVDAQVVGFEHQTFGAWVTGYGTGSGTVGAGSYGSRTPASGVPVGTSATYTGAAVGIARRADGQPYATASEVTVSTDFNSASISSTGTVAANLNTGTGVDAADLDFSGTGPVAGSGFVAAVSGTGTSGSAQGQFYGPNANEVGGTFTTTGAGGIVHSGAFGAN